MWWISRGFCAIGRISTNQTSWWESNVKSIAMAASTSLSRVDGRINGRTEGQIEVKQYSSNNSKAGLLIGLNKLFKKMFLVNRYGISVI